MAQTFSASISFPPRRPPPNEDEEDEEDDLGLGRFLGTLAFREPSGIGWNAAILAGVDVPLEFEEEETSMGSPVLIVMGFLFRDPPLRIPFNCFTSPPDVEFMGPTLPPIEARGCCCLPDV